jgi:two-component system LytT family response regulator
MFMTLFNAIIISEEKDIVTILKKFEEENFMIVKIIDDVDYVIIVLE